MEHWLKFLHMWPEDLDSVFTWMLYMITELSVHVSSDCREWHVLCYTCMWWMQKNSVYRCCIFGISQFIDLGRGNIWTCCLIFSAFDASGKRPIAWLTDLTLNSQLHDSKLFGWLIFWIPCADLNLSPLSAVPFFSPELSLISWYTAPWTCFTPNAVLFCLLVFM